MKIKLKCITVTFRFCSSRKVLCSWRQRFQFLAFRRIHKKLQLKLINMTIINSVWSLTLICYLWGTGLLKFVLARTTTKYLITKTYLKIYVALFSFSGLDVSEHEAGVNCHDHLVLDFNDVLWESIDPCANTSGHWEGVFGVGQILLKIQ